MSQESFGRHTNVWNWGISEAWGISPKRCLNETPHKLRRFYCFVHRDSNPHVYNPTSKSDSTVPSRYYPSSHGMVSDVCSIGSVIIICISSSGRPKWTTNDDATHDCMRPRKRLKTAISVDHSQSFLSLSSGVTAVYRLCTLTPLQYRRLRTSPRRPCNTGRICIKLLLTYTIQKTNEITSILADCDTVYW